MDSRRALPSFNSGLVGRKWREDFDEREDFQPASINERNCGGEFACLFIYVLDSIDVIRTNEGKVSTTGYILLSIDLLCGIYHICR